MVLMSRVVHDAMTVMRAAGPSHVSQALVLLYVASSSRLWYIEVVLTESGSWGKACRLHGCCVYAAACRKGVSAS